MTHRFICALQALIIVVCCQHASAGDAEKFLEHFSWWEGTWTVETKTGEATKTSTVVISSHKPACHLVEGDGISLWGYDPNLRTWVGSGFAEDGHYKDVLQRDSVKPIRPGVEHLSKIVSWKSDGTKVLADATWKYVNKDKAVIHQVRRTADGTKLPAVVLTCIRK